MDRLAFIARCTAIATALTLAAPGCGGDDSESSTSGSTATTTTTTSGTAPTDSDVVINEISASGDDWVELVNRGDAPFDLGDHALADTDMGAPKLSEAVRFPAGTTLAPGEFLLVLADQMTAPAGPQTMCLPGGPDTCFHALWAISAKDGERVHLVSPEDEVLADADYPPNAVPLGQTWGRLPDGTGAFAANAPTPGAANQGP